MVLGRKDNDQAGDDSLRALALCITNIRQKTPISLTQWAKFTEIIILVLPFFLWKDFLYYIISWIVKVVVNLEVIVEPYIICAHFLFSTLSFKMQDLPLRQISYFLLIGDLPKCKAAIMC